MIFTEEQIKQLMDSLNTETAREVIRRIALYTQRRDVAYNLSG